MLSGPAYNTYLEHKEQSNQIDAALMAEAVYMCSLGNFATPVQMWALSSVLKRPIFAVHPDINEKVQKVLHGIIFPRESSGQSNLYIMWTAEDIDSDHGFSANHFVPLLKDNIAPSFQKNVVSSFTGLIAMVD